MRIIVLITLLSALGATFPEGAKAGSKKFYFVYSTPTTPKNSKNSIGPFDTLQECLEQQAYMLSKFADRTFNFACIKR